LLSLDPEGAHLISQALLPIVQQAGAVAIGGTTLGADPIVTAVALASHLSGRSIPAFIVRKESKDHGTKQNIEGPLVPDSKVVIVDDVCTTGGSLFHAIEAAEEAGCEVVKVISLLDRMEGGSDEMRKRGYDFASLLSATPEGMIEPSLD
jgi:orotate phosphoribosyltransferase